ncbi:VOC family protein [Gracilibacillus massiliensis]|uniref:VOC family protein n=1 Tax=Gracilibacillus massiliensis TaxID=1564956 RepID=UPI000A8556EF|nr:hypothetical protein [Gracilibacillus massiliensis]
MNVNPIKTFINLSTKDLQKAITFFKHIGFSFNLQFTDDTAACMVINDQTYAMLLTKDHFKNFT